MENTSGNMWKWLTGMLVVCNLALLATVWFRPQTTVQYNMDPGGGHRGRMPRYDDKLNLTTEQQASFQAMTAAHQLRIDSLKKLAKATREQFFANVNTATPNQQEIDKLSAQLGDYHRLIELETYNNFRRVRAMLHADQQKIFDTIIKDVLTRMPEQPHFKGDGMGPEGSGRREGRPGGADDPAIGVRRPPPDGQRPPPPDGQDPPPPPDGQGPPPDGQGPPPQGR